MIQQSDVLEIVDNYNNKLLINKTSPYSIKLHQGNENRIRDLGFLVQTTPEIVVYKKHEKESDIYRKTKAWSIHARILDFANEIEYETSNAIYRITTQEAKIRSGRMVYKNASYTSKVYIPIKYWKVEYKNPSNQKLYEYLGYEWYSEIRDLFDKDYMKSIGQSVTALRSKNCVFPVKEEVFNAFRHCSFLDTNVVIIGQDPYHDGSAHGLAFSIREGQTKVPPSLRNILKEVQDDYYSGNFAFKSAHSPTLTRWSEQGILLLNKTLTVNKGKANSHSNLGWGKFTQDVIDKLIKYKITSKKPIVFILWGKESQKLAPTQESDYIKVIKAPHPAAEVYAGGKAGFFGSKPFTQCNEFLEKFSTQEIVW